MTTPEGMPPLDYVPTEGWRDDAACRGCDTGQWFPEQGVTRPEVDRLKAICASCPVRLDCLTVALDECEKFGFFGGASERDRRTMRQSWPRRACHHCHVPMPWTPAAGNRPTCDPCASAKTAKARMERREREARLFLWDMTPKEVA